MATAGPSASLAVHLLGRPRIVSASGSGYQFRSRKSWAVLAYLLLQDRPPTRARLAALLFTEADDPARALRWTLAEIRRALGPGGSIDGDPVVLRLPDGALVDVDLVVRGSWAAAVELPGLGADLLDGMTFRGAAAFETWLLNEQRRLTAACEAVLHEAALASMARGALPAALDYAVRAAAIRPLDENHQALVVRLYRLTGDDVAAEKQYVACVATFERELGVAPGPALQAALRERRHDQPQIVDDATIEAIIEAGSAAVSAGVVDAGLHLLRSATRFAVGAHRTRLRISARLVLAEALIHALRGRDEEGVAALHEADEIADRHDLPDAMARARAELGYVDFLRARYDRAELWLTDALRLAGDATEIRAKALTYLGSVHSDRSDYRLASTFLEEAVALARVADAPRLGAYALAMLGRVNLFREDLDLAAEQMDASIACAEQQHWLSFLPWPQALRGHVELARGNPERAAPVLRQAFARACQIGDPCWEGLSARGLALVAEAEGDTGRAFAMLAEARVRGSRYADPYVWLECFILDAQCELGRRHRHAGNGDWVATMQELASRTGMRELAARALLHGAALGNDGDAVAAGLLATEVQSPALQRLLGA
jgi:DNA-binding SARP family transcriptional activator